MQPDFSMQQNYKTKDYLTFKVQVEKTWEITVNDHAYRRSQSNSFGTQIWNKNYEVIGVLGELTFQILIGIPMDMRVGVKDPYDFKVRGIEIDIKSTENSNKMPIKKNRFYKKSNYYYVFCRVNLQTYENEFLGWITGDKVEMNGKFEYGKWKVHKSKLNSMESLERILRNKNALSGTGVWI